MKKPWPAFAGVASRSFVRGLVTEASHVPPSDLVLLDEHQRDKRLSHGRGHDPLRTLVAYAQDRLIYDKNGNLISADAADYAATPRAERLNVFGLAYRRDAKLYLHRTLADIIVGAAIDLYETQGWTTVVYDGLRTVDGAFNLYNFATDADIENGLLALPGQSAHNKGLAVDSMMCDAEGREVEMGGHFDHLDMETNSRAYTGDKISAAAQQNRLIREAAFLRSAFAQGLLVAPLRSEFWDDRPPENREDLWRVLDSAARCMGITLLSPEDIALRKKDRPAFTAKWESWDYARFLDEWRKTFRGMESEVKEKIGAPPAKEKPEFYHGNYHPIYDESLKASGKHQTTGKAAS